MIVVDSNIIAYFYLPNPQAEQAESLFLKEPDWIVPLLWRSEFRNILIGYIRKGLISLDDAKTIMREAEERFDDNEYRVNSDKVLELAAGSRCSAYDCEFVALAMDMRVKLVTADKELLKAFPKICLPIGDFRMN